MHNAHSRFEGCSVGALSKRGVVYTYMFDIVKTYIAKYSALAGTLCAMLARDERE